MSARIDSVCRISQLVGSNETLSEIKNAIAQLHSFVTAGFTVSAGAWRRDRRRHGLQLL
jgi:hypothetical protein